VYARDSGNAAEKSHSDQLRIGAHLQVLGLTKLAEHGIALDLAGLGSAGQLLPARRIGAAVWVHLGGDMNRPGFCRQSSAV